MEEVLESTLLLLPDSSFEDSLASSAFLFFPPDQIFCLGLQGSLGFFTGLNKFNSVSPVLLRMKSLKIRRWDKNVNYVFNCYLVRSSFLTSLNKFELFTERALPWL